MAINCALFGDLHLNVPKRTEEARRVAEWIRDDAKSRGVHLFGIPGDVMDGPMTELDRIWLQAFLRSCADIAPIIIAAGNHDARYSLGQFRSRSVDQRETNYPIYVEEAADLYQVPTEAGVINVACVAFPWKAEILARTGNIGVEDADQVAQEALRTVFLGMGARVRKLGLPTLALVHAAMRGSKISSDQPARPLGLEIPVEDLAQIGAHFGVVGHVHLGQEFEFNGVRYVTPTSPFYTDFGEAKHPKGYVWAEFKEVFDNAEERIEKGLDPWEVEWSRIPTPVTPMLLAEGVWNGESFWNGHKDQALKIEDIPGADIRFRFRYQKDQEKSAKAKAEEYAGYLDKLGAVRVTLDPVPEPAIRSRIPELAEATTLERKAELYRQSTNAVVEGDERKILDSMVQEIQEELAQEGVSFGIQSRAVPTLKRIRGKGWLCFPDEFDIDVSALGDLTAIVAPNESGKTTFISLAGPGLLYGDTPNRGTLDDLSRSRDAFIEGTFDMDGVEYQLAQMSNAMVKTNKGHVNLTSGGKPVLQKAGRREYQEWADAHLLPWNQYLSLLFHSGSEDDGGRKINIIDMKDAARTELMLKVLGIEFYEAIAKKARDRASAVSAELDRVNARLSELGQDDLEHLSEVVSDYSQALDGERGNLVAAESELAQQREKAAVIETQRTEGDALIRQQVELQSQEARLREKIADIEKRVANNQEVVAHAEAIRQAHVDVDTLSQQLDNCQERDRDLRIAGAKIKNILDIANREYKSYEAKRNDVQATLESLSAVIATKESVQATIDSIPEFEKAVQECIADRDGAFKEYEEVQAQAVAGKDERIGGLRTGLLRIYHGEESDTPVTIAGQTIDADDAAAKNAEEHPAKLRQAKGAWQQRDECAKEVTAQLERLKREAEKMPDIEAAEQKKVELMMRGIAHHTEMIAIQENIAAKSTERDELLAKIAANDESAKVAAKEHDELKPLADKLSILESAETRITELAQQRKDIQYDLDGVVDRLGRLVIPDAAEPLNLKPYEEAVASVQKAIGQCQSGLAVAEKALTDAKAKEQRVAELQDEAVRLRSTLDRWNRIAREFGVDALQKEEISNAGGALTSLVNELLRAGGDMDHTVDIRTERPHSRESRMIPCFEILVSDSRIDAGAPKEARRLSGYGQTVIGKALSMAMTRLGCERAGIHSCTIWFDELCGTATPDNAIRIIGMVRHFASWLNAKIFFVDQDPDIQALADNQLRILDGRIEVA